MSTAYKNVARMLPVLTTLIVHNKMSVDQARILVLARLRAKREIASKESLKAYYKGKLEELEK